MRVCVCIRQRGDKQGELLRGLFDFERISLYFMVPLFVLRTSGLIQFQAVSQHVCTSKALRARSHARGAPADFRIHAAYFFFLF